MAPNHLSNLGVLELGKAAKLLSEISAISREVDLQQLQVISKETDFLTLARKQVEMQAQVKAQSYNVQQRSSRSGEIPRQWLLIATDILQCMIIFQTHCGLTLATRQFRRRLVKYDCSILRKTQ